MKIELPNKVFDTSALMTREWDQIFSDDFKTIIPTIVLEELEKLKSDSRNIESAIAAQQVIKYLFNNKDKWTAYIYSEGIVEYLKSIFDKSQFGFLEADINNDKRILASAIDYDKLFAPDNTIFVTNDLSLSILANLYFGNDSIEQIKPKEDGYNGYKELIPTEEELSELYSDPTKNIFNLLINEYLILKNEENKIIDVRRWTGKEYDYLKNIEFDSMQFGKITPYKNDIYQKLAFDCLFNNQITMLRGPAGSGKSLLSLGYLFQKLESNEIDKIIIFCNTVAARNAARLGFYPGSRFEKLLDSQIGNMLSSKLGGTVAIEQLMQQEKLILLPMSDIRGYDTSGMRAGIYITEAQNLDITLMKLALQRIGEDCICIIDGDDETQVDMNAYAGNLNGMKRVSKIFRDSSFYGEVKLKTIHRSRIASLAESL